MILNKIKLRNIRSYTNQEINFPEGSTLLAGNIGSGKSTILLAIDFALFGLRRGTGAALLRNGEDEGEVELHFELNGKDVVINRPLKKGVGITQEAGFVMVDGIKKQGTAIELKQKILELLNYPQELLTKSKSLIYKYTVYIPQEEMKTILLGEKEIRLDALRKIFGVDKYKLVQENTDVFISFLKQTRKEYEGKISDLEEKKMRYSLIGKETDDLGRQINEIEPILMQVNTKIELMKSKIKILEENRERLHKLRRDLDIVEVNLRNKIEQRLKNNKDIENLSLEVAKLSFEIKDKEFKDYTLEVEKLDREINEIELQKIEFTKKITEYNTKKRSSFEIKEDILKLDKCPTCKQEVTNEYKKIVIQEADGKITLYDISLNELKLQEKTVSEKLIDIKKKREFFRNEESKREVFNLKLKNIEDRKALLEDLNEIQTNLKVEIGKLNIKKLDIEKEAALIKIDDYSTSKQELEELMFKQKKLELNKNTLNTKLSTNITLKSELEKEIEKKTKIKSKINDLIKWQTWLGNDFISLIQVMEKKIMLRIHSDFDSLLQKWFFTLVDDENLKIRLDDEFTPIIEQNGYETDYLHLSGGEKTAAALAYRLALNQVINTLMSRIETKELLILDEPTDGFSSEQLDRMRVVLDELNLKQIIIVSHESKIETFVDNVVKLQKIDGITKIV